MILPLCWGGTTVLRDHVFGWQTVLTKLCEVLWGRDQIKYKTVRLKGPLCYINGSNGMKWSRKHMYDFSRVKPLKINNCFHTLTVNLYIYMKCTCKEAAILPESFFLETQNMDLLIVYTAGIRKRCEIKRDITKQGLRKTLSAISFLTTRCHEILHAGPLRRKV